MTAKQTNGSQAPDGGVYGTLCDGSGNLATTPTSTGIGGTKQTNGMTAPDGSTYIVLTTGTGNLV